MVLKKSKEVATVEVATMLQAWAEEPPEEEVTTVETSTAGRSTGACS